MNIENNAEITIAVAEDHTIFRQGIINTLTVSKQFRLLYEAENGKELICKIEAGGDVPDVCILDIEMPVMNGHETTLALLSKWPNIKILALSMYNDEFNIIKMVRNGAKGYLDKTADHLELREAVNGIMNASFYLSEMTSGRMMKRLKNTSNTLDQEITPLEEEFLSWSCSGLIYDQIATHMNMSRRQLETIRENLFAKLGVASRPALVVYAMNVGIEPKS
jgi:two-component system invasion response regulator UvrY